LTEQKRMKIREFCAGSLRSPTNKEAKFATFARIGQPK
jgi:hypothetical protein